MTTNKLSPIKVYVPVRFTFATPPSKYEEAKFKSDYEYLKEQESYVFSKYELVKLLDDYAFVIETHKGWSTEDELQKKKEEFIQSLFQK